MRHFREEQRIISDFILFQNLKYPYQTNSVKKNTSKSIKIGRKKKL